MSVPAPVSKPDVIEISVRVNNVDRRHAIEPRELLAAAAREAQVKL